VSEDQTAVIGIKDKFAILIRIRSGSGKSDSTGNTALCDSPCTGDRVHTGKILDSAGSLVHLIVELKLISVVDLLTLQRADRAVAGIALIVEDFL